MTKSILRYFITILIVTLLSTCLLSAALISNSLLTKNEKEMLYSLKLIDYAIDFDKSLQDQILELNPLAYNDDTRISIIDKNGRVLADTVSEDVSKNHLDRQEVQDALKNNVGYAQRRSETTHVNMLYVAYYNQRYILRLSIPYNGIIDHLPALIPGLSISAVISFVIAYVLSRRLALRISQPMIEISDSLEHMTEDFRFDLKHYEYQEFNNVVDTIHNLSHRLRKSIREVNLEKIKMDELLKQMNEGFVLLDEHYKVLSINAKATTLLGYLKIHDSFLEYIHYPSIINALENNTYKQVIELKINQGVYACYITRINLGTTLLFVDITASQQAEKMRREFFSNVSHELKTPITSIKGYSELLAGNYVKDEHKKTQMLQKIQEEVDRISSLINDILFLSRIENMDIEVEMLPMRIKPIVEEVLESYAYEIHQHDIQINIDFSEITYIGNHSQIYTLFNNLIGNAIKYNKDGGSVDINVYNEINAIKIIVKDTGIGIPLADQARVFERFYRVDKGRSKQRGGTGLGLAIVKHIVSYYNGSIRLESQLGIGTTIEIILPQQSIE